MFYFTYTTNITTHLHTVFTRVYVDPPILEPKNKFFLFLGKNVLQKLIFYLRICFQVHYVHTKKYCPELFFISVFDPSISWGQFFGPTFKLWKVDLYTLVNMVHQSEIIMTQLLYITYNTYKILYIVFALHFLQYWIPSRVKSFSLILFFYI